MAQESDEDGDGAGLGPAKILKPIFSNGAASGNQPTPAPKKPQTQAQKPEPRVYWMNSGWNSNTMSR